MEPVKIGINTTVDNSLFALKQALKAQTTTTAQKVLLYGQGKVGKTMLAGTAIKATNIKRVFWFDLENGSETLLNPALGLSDLELKKVRLIKVPDVKDKPAAIETMLKVFSAKTDTLNICTEHGIVNCTLCKAVKDPIAEVYSLRTLNETDLVVVDSLSQLTLSALNAAERLVGNTGNSYAKWGEQGALLEDFCTMVQAAKCNIICITHEQIYEDDKTGKEYIVPNVGTRNFSRRVARFFGTVIFMSVEAKSFKAGSTPTYKLDTVAGSRSGYKAETDATGSLTGLFNQNKGD